MGPANRHFTFPNFLLAPALGRRVIQMCLSTITIRLNFFAVIVARIVPVVEQIVEDAER